MNLVRNEKIIMATGSARKMYEGANPFMSGRSIDGGWVGLDQAPVNASYAFKELFSSGSVK